MEHLSHNFLRPRTNVIEIHKFQNIYIPSRDIKMTGHPTPQGSLLHNKQKLECLDRMQLPRAILSPVFSLSNTSLTNCLVHQSFLHGWFSRETYTNQPREICLHNRRGKRLPKSKQTSSQFFKELNNNKINPKNIPSGPRSVRCFSPSFLPQPSFLSENGGPFYLDDRDLSSLWITNTYPMSAILLHEDGQGFTKVNC